MYAFSTTWPPAFNRMLPTSSGVYPYNADAHAYAAAQKSCGCGPCAGKGSCGGGMAGLGACSCVAKDPGVMSGLGRLGLGALEEDGTGMSPGAVMFWRLAGIAGSALGAYHGYARNDSVGWAIAWGLLGGVFPLLTIPVALAQGFGDPA